MSFLRRKIYDSKLEKHSIKDCSAVNTSRYNLLIFADRIDFGDSAKNIIDIANGLVKRNVNVTILASSVMYRMQLDEDIDVIILNVVKNKLMPLFMKTSLVAHICGLRKIDIILTISSDCAYIAKRVARKMNIKLVTYINDILDVKDKYFRKKNEIMTKGDLVFISSLYACNYILDNYSIDQKKIKVIRSGIDTNIFNIANVTKGRKLVAMNYLGEQVIGKRILLFPSRFNDKKCQMTLIEAISRLEDKDDKNFICVLIGDFAGSMQYINQLVYRIKKLGLEKYILIFNKFDDMPAIYSLSYAIFALSKGCEASMRIIAEAGAMFRPSISMLTGVVSNYVINENSGYLIVANNIVELKIAIRRILSVTNEQYNKMCMCAHRYILQYFDVRKTIIDVDDAFTSLI